jgi:predicted MPP superfamily phosphohydrolase
MSWQVFGFVFLLFAGYAKLTSSLLNRSLAKRHSKSVIVVCESLHFISMPVYALVLLVSLFSHGGWLRERAWHQFTPLEWTLIPLGIVGLIMLVLSTIAYQRYRPPACELSNDSKTIDFRKTQGDRRWQETLVGHRMRRIALLPGNEQFTLEVNTKTYSLPRLPKEWDGLSIVHFADTHFTGAVTRSYFEAVCEQAISLQPDLFVFTGDLLDDINLVDWISKTLGPLRAPLGQYFVLGNHDWYAGPAQIRAQFEQCGWTDVSGRSTELVAAGKPAICLAGDESPWMGNHPDLSQPRPEMFRILLSHTPDNINWAKGEGIDLMLAGHTHGGQIRLPILGPVYSPSRYCCRYASGVFWEEPTLMYVSRAISGREPIRYLCPPELTKLVLRSEVV